MKKLLIMLLIIPMMVMTGCKKDPSQITVVLDWTPNTNHTGLYVAVENGYFSDNDLEVEIIQPSGTSEPLVAANTAQFGISAQEYVIAARANDLPVVSIASIIANNTSGFISRESSNIQSPKDFEGKTYCGWGSPTESSIIKEMVEADGGNFANVEITTNYLDIFTDVNEDCDFFWVFEGWQVEKAKLDEIDYNYMSMLDYSDNLNFYTPVIITNEKMIEENEEVVESFMEAIQKGYQYAIDNPEESANILIKHVPELNEELVRSSQLYLSSVYKDSDFTWGYQKDTLWTGFNNWLVQNEIVSSITIDDAYTNKYINE